MSEQHVETLSQEIIKKANKTITICDDLGRKIVLKKPKWSAYLTLLKALGPELSANSAYVENVAIISTVVSIDESPVYLKAPLDIDYVVKKLEESDDALPKIAAAVVDNFSDDKSLEEHIAEVKK